MATLHIPRPIKPTNRISIEIDISGQSFSFDYKIPDAPGNVPATSVNQEWIDEQFRAVLKSKFGTIL